MTSTPVTAGVGIFFPGSAPAATQSGAGAGNAFSDVLKNQTGTGSKAEDGMTPKVQGSTAAGNKVSDNANRRDAVKNSETGTRRNTEKTAPEDAVAQAEKAAEAMAGEMVTQTAEELGISEEEVLEILESLDMTPMDLLNVANLQAVVLAVAGETDATGLVTNEQLFADFKQLSGILEEMVAEVADATGLSEDEVHQVFEELAARTGAEALPVEMLAEEPAEELVEETDTEDTVLTFRQNKEEGVTENVIGAETAETAQTDSTKKETAQSNESNAFDQTGGGFNQSFSAQVQADVLSDVQHAESFFTSDTEKIMNQITDYMKAQITEGVSELDMQLHPANLGNLHVKLIAKEGMVTAQFTAQNEVVKAALESQMVQLKETFKEQGVSVEAIEVTVSSHRFDENLQQNSGSNENDGRQSAKQRNRRINLNALEEEEILDEEDRLAAEVLADNGGTVDFTA
ncbi:MAG: flagellar hook-length control protein FliK [Lachnospiraceae bacterium]|nr:flagellar hook-length control protein FliK [Lachnospiraceae bacterium]